MHTVAIPQSAVSRVLTRTGRLHVHDDLDPRKTALIVIDLQNGFMVEEVAVSYVPEAVSIVPNVNTLAAAVRRTGGKVFWVKMTATSEDLETWSNWFAMMTPAHRETYLANMAPGSRGHDLYAGLDVAPEDEIVDKHRYSAFLPESSDIAARLHAQGLDTVLITGTVTSTCCESSARDAAMMNFRTIMISDANAGKSDAEHNATLAAFYVNMGDVMETDFAIACLEKARCAI